jgi:hypothetical protein
MHQPSIVARRIKIMVNTTVITVNHVRRHNDLSIVNFGLGMLPKYLISRSALKVSSLPQHPRKVETANVGMRDS